MMKRLRKGWDVTDLKTDAQQLRIIRKHFETLVIKKLRKIVY